MTNEERARELSEQTRNSVRGLVFERLVAAAFVGLERETLERAEAAVRYATPSLDENGYIAEKSKCIEAIRALADQQPEPTPDLTAIILECAAQFDFYVEQHLTKNPPDEAKASTNREFAKRCRAALRMEEDGR